MFVWLVVLLFLFASLFGFFVVVVVAVFCCIFLFLLEGTIPALKLNKMQVCQIGVSFVLTNTSVMLNFMVFALSLCFLKHYRAAFVLNEH